MTKVVDCLPMCSLKTSHFKLLPRLLTIYWISDLIVQQPKTSSKKTLDIRLRPPSRIEKTEPWLFVTTFSNNNNNNNNNKK